MVFSHMNLGAILSWIILKVCMFTSLCIIFAVMFSHNILLLFVSGMLEVWLELMESHFSGKCGMPDSG